MAKNEYYLTNIDYLNNFNISKVSYKELVNNLITLEETYVGTTKKIIFFKDKKCLFVNTLNRYKAILINRREINGSLIR